MSWTVVIYGIVPLIVFVLVDMFASLKWAVISSIAFAIFDVLLSYYTLGAIDPGSILALLLLCILGFVSLRKGDARWVKLQPVILSVGFALFVLYFQAWGQPIVERYLPFMREAAPENARAYFDDPAFLAKMDRAVNALVADFLINACLVAYAAYKMSNVAWLLIRGTSIWVLLFISTILVMIF